MNYIAPLRLSQHASIGPADKLDSSPFEILGFDRGTYFYRRSSDGQFIALSASEHKPKNLLELAPLDWWRAHWPGRHPRQWNWLASLNALYRAAEAKGPHDAAESGIHQYIGPSDPNFFQGNHLGAWPEPMTEAACAASQQQINHTLSNKTDFAQRAAPAHAAVTVVDDAPHYSELALASQFTAKHNKTMRYVDSWGGWMIYDGQKWSKDTTLQAMSRARDVCRTAALSPECEERARNPIASAKTVAAVERLARPDHAVTPDIWDSDQWLLNTPDCTLDLRNGQTRPHRAEDYATKLTAVAPGGMCPIWHEFLNRITGGDDDLEAYLQRMAGYALSGSTRESALFFLYGTGANGKTVFLNTIAGILADYWCHAPIETFTATTGDRHPTDLAGLRGARLVTAIETEEGRRWAESKIKSLTGGDPISARFMRGDFFTYTPTFKLIIAGNHKPGLKNVDESVRRRFHLVPFSVTIPKEDRDHELPSKLRAEWPGILAWMIVGCREWQERGLAPPEAVTKATTAYLEAEDTLAGWIADCCELDANAWVGSSALFASWSTWAARAGEFVGSQKRFSQSLETRGLSTARKSAGSGFIGIRLRPVVEPNHNSAAPWGQ